MTHAEIKTASKNGYSNWEILSMLVQEGMEFPDASAKVALALRLPPDEVESMERDYDDIC